jgi:transposase
MLSGLRGGSSTRRPRSRSDRTVRKSHRLARSDHLKPHRPSKKRLCVARTDRRRGERRRHPAGVGRPPPLHRAPHPAARCRPLRQERRAAALATVRFETPPGQQLQIDLGEKVVQVAGRPVTVYLVTAVLGNSRRLYVRASLAQRQDDWLEGLGNPGFEAFRRDRGLTAAACRPRRARTKGKIERGVDYVKHNALAGRAFASFAALRA